MQILVRKHGSKIPFTIEIPDSAELNPHDLLVVVGAPKKGQTEVPPMCNGPQTGTA